MASDAKIQVVIELDDGSVKQGFLRMEKAADESAGNISKFFQRAGSFAVGIVLEKVFTNLFGLLKEGFRDSIAAAREQETAMSRLANSLATAGTFSKQAMSEFVALADEIERTTTVQDDAALSLAALARNYTRTNDQAKALTLASIDLSAQLGISLDSAAQTIGTTFSGVVPRSLAKTVSGLKDLTVEQLRAGAGLELIAKRFEGAAANEVRTFSGALAQLKNSFNGLQEIFGDLVVKSPAVLKAFEFIKNSIDNLKKTLLGFNKGDTDIFKPIILSAIRLGELLNMFVVIPFTIAFDAITIIVNTFARLFVGTIGKIAGTASQMVGLFAPDSELFFNLQAFNEQSKVAFDELGASSIRAADSMKTAFSGEDTASLYLKNMRGEIESTSGALVGIGDTAKNNTKLVVDAVAGMLQRTQQLNQAFNNALAGGISSTIQKTVTALAQGRNGFKAFAQGAISAIGDIAIQMGTFFLTTGLGMKALLSNPATAAGALIVQGAALIAVGTLIKSFSGDGSTSVPTTSASGGGSTTSPINEPTVIDEKSQSRLVVNIQGDVLDSRESGLRIVELINDAFDTQGAAVTARA